MPELDLAGALAQQAARGGRGGSAPAAADKPAAGSAWALPVLGRDFRIGDATGAALAHAAAQMGKTLRHEGLVIQLQQTAGESPVTVMEKNGGRVLQAYDTAEFLSVFSRQRQLNGVIVDGQV